MPLIWANSLRSPWALPLIPIRASRASNSCLPMQACKRIARILSMPCARSSQISRARADEEAHHSRNFVCKAPRGGYCPGRPAGRPAAGNFRYWIMSAPRTMAVDAMGGDIGPEMVVPALDLMAARHPDWRFLVFGNSAQIEQLLPRLKLARSATEVRHAEI